MQPNQRTQMVQQESISMQYISQQNRSSTNILTESFNDLLLEQSINSERKSRNDTSDQSNKGVRDTKEEEHDKQRSKERNLERVEDNPHDEENNYTYKQRQKQLECGITVTCTDLLRKSGFRVVFLQPTKKEAETVDLLISEIKFGHELLYHYDRDDFVRKHPKINEGNRIRHINDNVVIEQNNVMIRILKEIGFKMDTRTTNKGIVVKKKSIIGISDGVNTLSDEDLRDIFIQYKDYINEHLDDYELDIPLVTFDIRIEEENPPETPTPKGRRD